MSTGFKCAYIELKKGKQYEDWKNHNRCLDKIISRMRFKTKINVKSHPSPNGYGTRLLTGKM